ncbi:MAG TPA: lasso peptide biosynthesis B2 protein [Methylomirabilota bacterium]|nr:lasso peptide biosynthesis B2 protein [Methylomirabilota bacterium]
MWDRLQRYKALDPVSRRMFRRAVLLLPLVRWSLHLRGYSKTFASLQKRVRPQASAVENHTDTREAVQLTCRLLRAAVRHSPAQFTCLEESLTLWFLLREQGIPASLRIGVRKENEEFEAHAWVEHGGEALNQLETLHHHYAAFAEELLEPPAEQQ